MAAETEWSLRLFRSGDVGMLCARQAILYDRLYGWGRPLEALIYEIAAKFLRDFSEGREQCWVADRAGKMLGAVLLVEDDADRSEEHTSELQSLMRHSYAVFCLKKK